MRSPSGDPSTPERGLGRERPGLGSRRVVWIAFGVSALLHLIAIFAYPFFADRFGPAEVALPEETEVPAADLEVVTLILPESTVDPDRPEDPEEIEDLEEPEAVPTIIEVPSDVSVDGELVPLGPTAAERLRIRMTDPRLWAPLPDEIVELSTEQREELIVAGRLEEWYDSVAAAIAAEQAATDWTFTDSDGNKWGVSPGKLHLGGITLPLPLSFGTPVGKRDEVAQRQWQWDEIMRQRARAEVEETWADRQDAIRERRDRERAATRPDTTRSRR